MDIDTILKRIDDTDYAKFWHEVCECIDNPPAEDTGRQFRKAVDVLAASFDETLPDDVQQRINRNIEIMTAEYNDMQAALAGFMEDMPNVLDDIVADMKANPDKYPIAPTEFGEDYEKTAN